MGLMGLRAEAVPNFFYLVPVTFLDKEKRGDDNTWSLSSSLCTKNKNDFLHLY